jgi:hypothetical protein
MKTPRVSDFDPHAKEAPSLRSSFEKMPAIQKSNSVQRGVKSEPVPPVRVVPLVPLVPGVRPVPPTKRLMKQRHPFDIYRDQYEALQELALEERKQGGAGSMSAMVREALDTFIVKKKQRGL